jgi:hypothetical protein
MLLVLRSKQHEHLMTTSTRVTTATIKRGDVVQAGYKKWLTANRFLGFYTDHLGTGLGFSNLGELKSNVADDDCWYALFQDCADGDEWAAYRFNGRWVVGSSADALKLTANS